MGRTYGLIGLVILILEIWAIINIIQSNQDTGKKVLWIVVILLLGPIGLLLWYFLGRN